MGDKIEDYDIWNGPVIDVMEWDVIKKDWVAVDKLEK